MDNDTQKENDSHYFARIDYEEMKECPGAFLHFRVFTGTFPKVSDTRQPIVSFQFLDEKGNLLYLIKQKRSRWEKLFCKLVRNVK